MIFAEIGATPTEDLFLRVEYDGSIVANGPVTDAQPPRFSAVSGTSRGTELMETLLRREHDPGCTLNRAMKIALDAWSAGSMPATEGSGNEVPSVEALRKHRAQELQSATVEACVLERSGPNAIRYRPLAGQELKELTTA